MEEWFEIMLLGYAASLMCLAASLAILMLKEQRKK